jgi:carboxyl-terminal processing protease
MFVPKGTEVLRTRGREVINERIFKTVQAPIDTKTKLFVLIDGQTASSAEIVAGSLQDMDRAVVVGSRSFGKGLVQTTRPLPYEAVLKVTTAKYYIPSGRLIQAIDYSRRTPDSLTSVYYTKAGREVRDGGGITPDVKVNYGDMNRLTYNIVSDNWAFDFATRYRAQHPTICPAEDFVVDDSLFNEFKAFIDPAKFSYDKVCEQMLGKLKDAAETEGYMNDSVKAELSRLESLLKHDLNHDLDNNRDDIAVLLSQEILKRYYYQRGIVVASLRQDAALDTVRNILSTPNRYKEILNPKH